MRLQFLGTMLSLYRLDVPRGDIRAYTRECARIFSPLFPQRLSFVPPIGTSLFSFYKCARGHVVDVAFGIAYAK